MRELMSEDQFNEWLDRLVGLFPQVEEVYLIGSRGFDYAREDSDWDVVVCLSDDCYDKTGRFWEQLDEIEQRITFYPGLKHDSIDLFFYQKEKGRVTRWQFPPGKMPRWVLDIETADEFEMVTHGDLLGVWDRLYRSLKDAKLVYSRIGD